MAPLLKPNKRYRLALWWLLYRWPIMAPVDATAINQVAQHIRMDVVELLGLVSSFPNPWQRMLDKRKRRRDYFSEHGYCTPGWTPPDPENPSPWDKIQPWWLHAGRQKDPATALGIQLEMTLRNSPY